MGWELRDSEYGMILMMTPRRLGGRAKLNFTIAMAQDTIRKLGGTPIETGMVISDRPDGAITASFVIQTNLFAIQRLSSNF